MSHWRMRRRGAEPFPRYTRPRERWAWAWRVARQPNHQVLVAPNELEDAAEWIRLAQLRIRVVDPLSPTDPTGIAMLPYTCSVWGLGAPGRVWVHRRCANPVYYLDGTTMRRVPFGPGPGVLP